MAGGVSSVMFAVVTVARRSRHLRARARKGMGDVVPPRSPRARASHRPPTHRMMHANGMPMKSVHGPDKKNPVCARANVWCERLC